MVSLPVYPRATLMADMVASVPEFTIRTRSMEGTSEVSFLATSVSISVGAPKLSPWPIAS